MSVRYAAVGWNRQKQIYDGVAAIGVAVYLTLFIATSAALFPTATAETLLIRATGTAALLLLHIILSIGPLCRVNPRYLPLLYNRRHLGVLMFLLALIHGVVSMIQFHALGDANPIVSLFFGHTDYDRFVDFPFQTLGFFALVIFFLMAATSHDFWLATLTPPMWKALHMLVYPAYALIVMHVALGILQDTRNPAFAIVVGAGMVWLLGLHLRAATRPNHSPLPSSHSETASAAEIKDEGVPAGFHHVGNIDELKRDRAKTVEIGGERIAVFRVSAGESTDAGSAADSPSTADTIYAIAAVCRHQNGPLGEGRIIDGCVTCPWHGFQYDPATGKAPPPFTEQVACFSVHITRDREVYVSGEAR
ncbi:MAG: ferric reductase-like transmembrane domain-containing protein [Leptospirales bacterium]|jgi:sulfoxide reductase heme-binding subunit YedZ